VKIINILGSPRKNGASARIARAFAETAVDLGATVRDYHLNTMHYQGCQACEGCHTRADRCVLRDDLSPLLADLHTAEIVLFSSPIYFGDTSGQFKCFFDRMWSLVRTDARDGESSSRLPPGKTAVLILSQVETSEAHQEVQERYTMHLDIHEFKVRVISAAGNRLQSDTDVSPCLHQAIGLARELLQAPCPGVAFSRP